MNCPSCGHRNREDNLYCTQCGVRLDPDPGGLGRLTIISETGARSDQRRRTPAKGVVNERRSGFDITQYPLKIGRNDDNNFIVTDEQASAHHAQITTDGNQFWMEDLDSTNGTYIDGIRIKKSAPLHTGSLIKIGNTIIKFELYPDDAA